jgi:MHS family dicarboxylic acid transporter PcaT-like MFS transporter
MTGALFLYMCMQPFFGMLAGRSIDETRALVQRPRTLCTVPILLSLKASAVRS